MAFQQGLSGLSAASKALDVISNNVANSGTVGFKQAQTQFGDVYAASLANAGSMQVGIGASVASVAQQFTQGNITSTGNALDMAINGQGFFQLSGTSGITYSRNGQFQVDKNGYIVNSTGQQLMGITALPDGTSTGTVGPLQLNVSDASPKASTTAGFNLNVDSRSSTPAKLASASVTGTTLTTMPLTIPAATTPNLLSVAVDGGAAVTITVPPGSYADMAAMASAIQSAMNGTALSGKVTVAAAGAGLQFTSTNTSASAAVNVSGSLASGWTMGAAAGASQTATPASTTVPEPANSILLSVDNAIMPTAVSIAAGTYNTPSALVTAIQSAIDQTNLKGRVTVGLDSTGNALTFSSDRSGRLSSVQVSGALASSTLNMPGTVGTATNAGFSINSPTSYTSTTSQTVYDSLGNAHNLSMYFVKTATDNVWDVYTSLDGGFPPEIDPVSGTHTPWTVNFGTDGILKSPTSATKSYALSNGATSPLAFTIDLKGTTEFGNSFGINQLTQDGYTTGKLSGLSVSGDGIITGRFSNGQARNMGQLQLVSFQNPNGLQSLGNNQWGASSTSGAAQPNVPGSGILGAIQSGSVEDSNVDLTAELVDMITQQRAYQANAQSIKTQDQLLQTLVNLR